MPRVGPVLKSLSLPPPTARRRHSKGGTKLPEAEFFAIEEVHCTPTHHHHSRTTPKLQRWRSLATPMSNPVQHFQFTGRERHLTPVSQTIWHEMCRYDESVGKAISENYARLMEGGKLFELVFRDRKLGFTVVLARLKNSPRPRLLVEETFETCPAFNLLMPTDELIAINGSLLIPIDMEAFPALVAQLQQIERPLRLTFAKTDNRARAFRRQELRRTASAGAPRGGDHSQEQFLQPPRPVTTSVLELKKREETKEFFPHQDDDDENRENDRENHDDDKEADQPSAGTTTTTTITSNKHHLVTEPPSPPRAATVVVSSSQPLCEVPATPLAKTTIPTTTTTLAEYEDEPPSPPRFFQKDLVPPPFAEARRTFSTASYDSAVGAPTSRGSFCSSENNDEERVSPRGRLRDVGLFVTLDPADALDVEHVTEGDKISKKINDNARKVPKQPDDYSCGCVGFDDAHCGLVSCLDGGDFYYRTCGGSGNTSSHIATDDHDDVPISPPPPPPGRRSFI
mmetsp:Transcript_36155/g.115790  ORF Transcript_36155/g.115790 Transcript_36155/m.115790 type:complete len:512 (-) Transcript_36155:509-2044(-)